MSETRHLVCPHCAALNRVPTGRPAGQAICGSCKAKLFDGQPHDVDSAGFEHHVRANDIPVLVDVWAPWCGPCRTMAPHFARAAGVLEPEVRLIKLNADTAPEIGARYSVKGIPAMLLFRGGSLVAQTAGAMDAGAITRWVQGRLVPAA